MFFPFLDYTTQSFSTSSSDSTIFTTTYKCLIVPEMTEIPNETSNVFYENPDRVHIVKGNSNLAGTSGAAVVPSGVAIRAQAVGTGSDIAGTLHVFRMPD